MCGKMVDDSILENDGKTGDALKTATVAGDDDSKKVFSIEILRLIRNAQKQHGLRHGDYQRYRGNGSASTPFHFHCNINNCLNFIRSAF